MKKTSRFTAALIFLFFSITGIFLSCQKNSYEVKAIQLDRANKFFNTTKRVDEKTEALIRKLKIHNDKTNFLNAIPENIGLPIWDKIYFNDKKKEVARSNSNEEEILAVSIPLTDDNQFLSSVILVETRNDTVLSISPYTNTYLYNLAHGTSIDVGKAQAALALFLFMDYQAFGTTKFKNIPKTVFPQIQFNDNFKETTELILNTSNLTNGETPRVTSTCWEITWQVVNCGTPNYPGCNPVCDQCGTYCTMSTVGVTICSGGGGGSTDGGGSSGPGGVILPPSGGGGGGGGNNDNPPPPPPCGGVWYRTVECSNGGSDGGGTNQNILLIQQLNSILHNSDSYYFDNSIPTNNALIFNSVAEFQTYLNNSATNTSFDLTPPPIISPSGDQKTENAKVVLITFPANGGVDIDVKLEKDAVTGKWEVNNVTSSDYGYTFAWSWEHKEYSKATAGNEITVIVKGYVKYNVFLQGIGTLYKSERKYQLKIDKTTGKITSISAL